MGRGGKMRRLRVVSYIQEGNLDRWKRAADIHSDIYMENPLALGIPSTRSVARLLVEMSNYGIVESKVVNGKVRVWRKIK